MSEQTHHILPNTLIWAVFDAFAQLPKISSLLCRTAYSKSQDPCEVSLSLDEDVSSSSRLNSYRKRERGKCLCILHEDAFIAHAMSENLSVICNGKAVTKHLQKQEPGRKARRQRKDMTESKGQGSRNRVLELNVYFV